MRGNEDFVYAHHDKAPSCRYVNRADGSPDCLIGCILFDAGVPLETLADWDLLSPTLGGIGEVVLPKGLVITVDAMALLRAAQYVQDASGTWEEALVAARERRAG